MCASSAPSHCRRAGPSSNYASRFGYRSEAEVREVVAKFQQADIPLDAVVIDLYWFGDIQGHRASLDWDRETFPNAEQMLADLRAQGIKTILVTVTRARVKGKAGPRPRAGRRPSRPGCWR